MRQCCYLLECVQYADDATSYLSGKNLATVLSRYEFTITTVRSLATAQ